MKPILFEADTLDYSNNGIGVLYDVIRLEVEEERNGYFGLEMEYPVDGEWFKELKDQRLILAKPNDVDEPHVFRIYEIDKNLEDGVVYILANSITDDLSGNLVIDGIVEDATAQIALNEIKANLIEPTHFDFVSDIQTKSSSSWTRINPLQAMAGVRGSLVDLWGGEIKRTNKTLYLFSRRGKDKVTTIRPGKNIDGFNMVVSTKGMVTRILPFFEYSFQGLTEYEMVRDYDGNLVKQAKYATNSSETEPTTVLGDMVVSDLADKYPVNYHEPIDFSSDEYITEKVEKFINDKEEEIEKSPTIIDTTYFEDELKDYVKELVDDRASRYFTYDNPGVDKPNVEINVDILQLSDSPEWEKYKKLEHIQLTDTVEVYVRKFDVDVEVTISAIVYDSIGERVVSITAGSIQTSLSDSIKKEYEDTNLKMEQYYNTMVNGIQNTIMRTADGLNNKFTGYTEPSADISSEGDLWFKIVGPGEIEIYIYNGGRWVAQVSDAVLEAMEQDVEKALQDAEEAFEKANKATEDAEEAIGKAQEGFDKAQQAITDAGEAIGKAQEGFDKAQQAITDAGKADSKAEKALGDILEVETKAQQALDDSKEAFDKAKENITLIEDFSVRLGKNEDNYTTITGTVEGLEIEVGKKVDNTTYNSKMTQLDNLMQTMITEEDADGKYTKMSTFTQTVDSMQSDITKKVDNTTYNSKMTQLDNLMQTMITEEDAEGRFTKQTTFNQFADSFSTRVEEIENWEIGGRNLNKDSNNFSYDVWSKYDGGTYSVTENVEVEEWGATDTTRVRAGAGNRSSTLKVYKRINESTSTVEGETYTVSFYVKNKRDREMSVSVIGISPGPVVEIGANEAKRVVVTGVRNRGSLQLQFRSYGVGYYTEFIVWRAKVEKGNIATDWSPAPEDTEQKFSAIDQTIDSIATRVQTTEKNYSSMTQTVQGIQNTVANKADKSTVTQLAGVVDTKISTVDANNKFATQSQLTQTANSLTSTITSVKEDLDGFEIGGRNILGNSKKPYFRSNSNSTNPLKRTEYDDYYRYEPQNNTAMSTYSVLNDPNHPIYNKDWKGRSMTASIKVRVGKDVKLRLRFGYRGSTTITHDYFDVKEENGWVQLSVTSKSVVDDPEDQPVRFFLYTSDGSSNKPYDSWIDVKDWKIEFGNKATDWSPAPEDTDKKFSAINQTVDSIATRVQATEKNYSSISQTVSGVQTKVSNAEGNISTLTTLANTNQTKIRNAEGKITTLTQTATSLTSKIETIEDWEFGGRNLILDSEEFIFENKYLVKECKLSTDLVEGQKYTISITGMFLTNEKPNSRFGVWMNGGSNKLGDMKVVNDEGSLHSLTFVSRKPSSGNERKIRIYQLPKSELSTVAIAQAKLEKGNVRTDWSPAPEDKADTFYVSSQISQLQTAINLRVTKNDVVNQLNIDTSGVLISGKKITLDGDTTVLGTFKVGNAHILSGLTASKITTGTLNAANVAITNLNVNRLVGNMASFVSSGFNNISSQVSISSTGITTYSGGVRESLLNGSGHRFYRNNVNIGKIGTNSWVGDSNYRGLSFNLENNANYMAWSFKETSNASSYTTMLSWHKTGSKTNKGFHMDDNVHFRDDIFLGDAIATQSTSGYRVVRIRNETFSGVDGVAFRRGRTGGGGLFVTATQARLSAPISRDSSTHASLRVVGSTSSSYVESIDIYNRTYTASSQAMRVTSSGILGRITSSRRYKLLEKPIGLEDARKILTVKMKSWYDKQAVEDYAEALSSGSESEDHETISRVGGFIVEDIHDAGLGMFVSYDEYGRPEGLHTNIAYLAFPLLQDHEDRIDYLERKVQIQQDIIDDLMIKNAS